MFFGARAAKIILSVILGTVNDNYMTTVKQYHKREAARQVKGHAVEHEPEY